MGKSRVCDNSISDARVHGPFQTAANHSALKRVLYESKPLLLLLHRSRTALQTDRSSLNFVHSLLIYCTKLPDTIEMWESVTSAISESTRQRESIPVLESTPTLELFRVEESTLWSRLPIPESKFAKACLLELYEDLLLDEHRVCCLVPQV